MSAEQVTKQPTFKITSETELSQEQLEVKDDCTGSGNKEELSFACGKIEKLGKMDFFKSELKNASDLEGFGVEKADCDVCKTHDNMPEQVLTASEDHKMNDVIHTKIDVGKCIDCPTLNVGLAQDQMNVKAETSGPNTHDFNVIYKFCDIKEKMVTAWRDCFKDYIPERIQVYHGDIFKRGPAADAIVSPANSFGFMDGGIDMAYSLHFGWQMQDRLQEVIRNEHNGELLVGDAAIVTTVESIHQNTVNWSEFNEGQPIKYLISAPTMRVPLDVSDTVNAYLAFRAVILAVKKFNKSAEGTHEEPIRTVLCPGLGTAVGRMPFKICAYQMLRAFETFEMGMAPKTIHPENLWEQMNHHFEMTKYGDENGGKRLY